MNLKQLRAEAGISLRDLSALTGISKSMLSKAECGTSNLSPLNVVRVAKALGVPVAELMAVSSTDPDGGRAA